MRDKKLISMKIDKMQSPPGVVSVNVQVVPFLLRISSVLAMIQHDSPL